MTRDPIWFAQVVFAAIADIAFACTLGAILLREWLRGERAIAAPGHRARVKAQRLAFGGACVLLACDLVQVWLQAVSMSGVAFFDAFPAVITVVTSTYAGFGWGVAVAGSVVLLFAARTKSPRSLAMVAAIVGAIVAAAGKASIGHAADAGAFSLAEAVQTLHVLATALWGGIVIAGAMSVLPALSASTGRALLIRMMAKVSAVSIIAVVFVIATGIFNAWRGTGGSAQVLDHSDWGRALVVKLVFVATAFVLGGINRISAFPRLKRTASTTDARTVTGVMQVEAWLMIGVFIAACVLSHSVPGIA